MSSRGVLLWAFQSRRPTAHNCSFLLMEVYSQRPPQMEGHELPQLVMAITGQSSDASDGSLWNNSGCHAALSSLGDISAPAAELGEQALGRLPAQMSSPPSTTHGNARTGIAASPHQTQPLQNPSQTQVVRWWVGWGLFFFEGDTGEMGALKECRRQVYTTSKVSLSSAHRSCWKTAMHNELVTQSCHFY